MSISTAFVFEFFRRNFWRSFRDPPNLLEYLRIRSLQPFTLICDTQVLKSVKARIADVRDDARVGHVKLERGSAHCQSELRDFRVAGPGQRIQLSDSLGLLDSNFIVHALLIPLGAPVADTHAHEQQDGQV